MGNMLSPCHTPGSKGEGAKLVVWGGATRILSPLRPAGDIMVEFPDHLICHANSFYIGLPVPVLSTGEELTAGETYLAIPADKLACDRVLSAASIASLSSGTKRRPVSFGANPFEHVKTETGKSLIKISMEFMTIVVTGKSNGDKSECDGDGGARGCSLCSTPELRKHYEQLVGSRVQPWSPKLETISEGRSRSSSIRSSVSPVRLSQMRLVGR